MCNVTVRSCACETPGVEFVYEHPYAFVYIWRATNHAVIIVHKRYWVHAHSDGCTVVEAFSSTLITDTCNMNFRLPEFMTHPDSLQ